MTWICGQRTRVAFSHNFSVFPMGFLPSCVLQASCVLFASRLDIGINAGGRRKGVKGVHSFNRWGPCNPSPFTLSQSTLLQEALGVTWVQVLIKPWQGLLMGAVIQGSTQPVATTGLQRNLCPVENKTSKRLPVIWFLPACPGTWIQP